MAETEHFLKPIATPVQLDYSEFWFEAIMVLVTTAILSVYLLGRNANKHHAKKWYYSFIQVETK